MQWLTAGMLLAMTSAKPADADDATTSAPSSVLDEDQRNLRGNQVSIDGFGGSLVGGSIGHSYFAGARLTYYPIRHLGIGAAYGNSYIFNGRSLGTVGDRSVHFVHGQLELPLVSALRLGKHRTLQMDLFGEGGAGAVRIDGQWEVLGAIGGGVRLYPRIPWLAIRIDVMTFLHETRASVEQGLDGDVAFTVGLTFLLPPRRGHR